MTRRSRSRSQDHDETPRPIENEAGGAGVPAGEGAGHEAHDDAPATDEDVSSASASSELDTVASASDDVVDDGAELPSVELVPHVAAEPIAVVEATGDLAATLEVEPAGDAGPGNLLSDEELLRAVSALVFASPEPLSMRRLVDLLERPDRARVEAALQTLRERLAASGLALELRGIAGGHQILSTPDMGEVVQRLFKARKAERISGAGLETLAVVAYRQPVTKAEIEAIRGVQAGPILRTLIERGFVRVAGRADVPGHPLQYGTTREFLDRFGLESLDALPRDTELAKE